MLKKRTVRIINYSDICDSDDDNNDIISSLDESDTWSGVSYCKSPEPKK